MTADDLVERSRVLGDRLLAGLRDALAGVRIVGDVRGRGLLVGVELVADRATKAPFRRADRVVEQVVAAGKGAGVLLYPSTGAADGTDGDLFLVGPPLVVTDAELDAIVDRTARAVASVAASG
jgi:adenosylmethionine-8-amino-7-oxononanoate aminotransferase